MTFSTRSTSPRLQKKDRFNTRIRIFFLLVALLLIGIYILIANVGNTMILSGKYTVDRGYTIATLSEKLGFQIAPWRYHLWVRFFAPKGIKIQAGTYQVNTPVQLETFLTQTLKVPLYEDLTITILPGWNLYDIDEYFFQKQIFGKGEFLNAIGTGEQYAQDFSFLRGTENLEGFLYPDTYRIRPDATPDMVARILLKEFDKKIGNSYRMLGNDGYKKLILASIVEREEHNTKNQSTVAGILEKRVKEGIAMGADATICTGYKKTQKQCTPAFIGSVINEDNPYNTRKKRGYPPTPVSSVSLDTWKAVLSPQDSPYYYYLHDMDGNIHYASTNEEHVVNKNKYLK